MKVKRVSVVGVDDSHSLSWMRDVSREHPYVEWNVLLSASNGRQRYPSMQFVERMLSDLQGCHLAVHLSGGELEDVLAGVGPYGRVVQRFHRVQLYYRAGNFAPIGLRSHVSLNSLQTFSSTLTSANMSAWKSLTGLPNHSVMFSEASGLGVVPKVWPKRLMGIDCGWAGGLSPENLDKTLPQISSVSGGEEIWISMQGRLCTPEGRVSEMRVEEALDRVKSWNRGSVLRALKAAS